MLLPSVFKKTSGFSLVELLLILAIVAIILSGVGFYLIKFTQFGDDLFKNLTRAGQSDVVRIVDIPKQTHNQIIISVTNEPIQINASINHVLYAFDPDVAIGTEWPQGNSGFLVISNDKLNIKLLGYRYLKSNQMVAKDGYDALQNLDINADQKIDKQDIDYKNLYVWLDRNQNGKVDEGELKSLAELNIISIELNSTKKTNQGIGKSSITRQGSYLRKDGTKGIVADVDLFQDPYYREFLTKKPISDKAKSLPDAKGAGVVRDLREVATVNPKLLALIKNYVSTSSSDARFTQMDNILFEWRKNSGYPLIVSRLKNFSTPRFDIALDAELMVDSFGEQVNQKQSILREIVILENFTAKNLLFFSTQEILNTSTHRWELHLVVSYGMAVIVNQVILANQNDTKKQVILTADMITFSDIQIADIHQQYNQLKHQLFDNIQKALIVPNIVNQTETETLIEEPKNVYIDDRKLVDRPRKRHMSECIKPGNVIDQQVRDCAAGKIAKTW